MSENPKYNLVTAITACLMFLLPLYGTLLYLIAS